MRYLKAVCVLTSVVAFLGVLTACSGVKFQTFPTPTFPPMPSVPTNPVPSQPANPKPSGPANPKPTVPSQPPVPDYGPPVVTDIKKLAQDLYDDDKKGTAFGGYLAKNLEITGVVVSQMQLNGASIKKDTEPVGEIEFVVQVKDKAGAMKNFSVYGRFKEEVKPGTPQFAALAKGKTVTVRGHLTGGGKDSATLNDCVFVK